ncbi:MAG: hypothetical protein RJA07_2739 [Bacteroidota bacterium]|jgi:hypothetical protein
MTQVHINEHTAQGQAFIELVKTFPKKVATIIKEEEDLSDCISLEEFGNKLKAEVKKRYAQKKVK